MMKITVGKADKKRIIKYTVIFLVLALFLFSPFLFILIFFLDNFPAFMLIVLIFLILILSVFFLVIPGLTLMDFMWEVDEYFFRFMSFETTLDKIKLFYAKLFKKHYPLYQMSLRMSQIDFIQVTYYQNSFYPSKYLYRGSGYKVVFKFYMLDGSQYIFENFVGKDRDGFCAGIQFMKNYGIQFVDRYKIIEAYRDNQNMQDYLAHIEKEKDHD